MEWPKGILDDKLSKLGRWILHGLGTCWGIYLIYDLVANLDTDDGVIRWFNREAMSGSSIKFAFLLLVLIGLAGAVGLAFAFDFLTSQGSFAVVSHPNELQKSVDKKK